MFSLSKEDLTDVLSQFPAAKRHLEEKGRQILVKMGMLDESAEEGDGDADQIETKLTKLEDHLELMQTKLARLMVELESSNSKMQARVERLEWELASQEADMLVYGEIEEMTKKRGEGVGEEVKWEREEAEGEEGDSCEKAKIQDQEEDVEDVSKEGDGESTKSTKEEVERPPEGDQSGLKATDYWEEKKEAEKAEDGHGKGDGAEGECGSKKEEKSIEREFEEKTEYNEEDLKEKEMKK